MEYFCAIDGGGTSSKCIVEDRDGDIFECIGASSNIYGVGMFKALENIKTVIKEAFEHKNADISNLRSIHIASAGLGDEKNQELVKEELEKTFKDVRVTTSDDAFPLLVTENSISGICLIVGTGSIAFGIDNFGSTTRAGGFGWRLGDEGSAFWIAKEAIRRTLYSKEKIDIETDLDKEIVSYFNLEKLKDIIYFINDSQREKSEIANFSTAVLQYAENKDPLAQDIVNTAIDALFLLVDSIIKRMDAHEKKVILSGGIVLHYKWFAELLSERIKNTHSDYIVINAEPDRAKKGALLLSKKGF